MQVQPTERLAATVLLTRVMPGRGLVWSSDRLMESCNSGWSGNKKRVL
jgi:hypothetical protein